MNLLVVTAFFDSVTGHANKMYDLNVEASASGDEEDDIEWVDG